MGDSWLVEWFVRCNLLGLRSLAPKSFTWKKETSGKLTQISWTPFKWSWKKSWKRRSGSDFEKSQVPDAHFLDLFAVSRKEHEHYGLFSGSPNFSIKHQLVTIGLFNRCWFIEGIMDGQNLSCLRHHPGCSSRFCWMDLPEAMMQKSHEAAPCFSI